MVSAEGLRGVLVHVWGPLMFLSLAEQQLLPLPPVAALNSSGAAQPRISKARAFASHSTSLLQLGLFCFLTRQCVTADAHLLS